MVSICACVVAVIGAAVVVAGSLLGFVFFPSIIEERVTESVQLVEGSEAFDRWEVLPLPLVFKLYFFNVTNVDDVQQGATPIANEIGPYVYKQYRTKYNVTREDDILSYYQHQHMEFDDVASAPLTEYDDITIVNLPLMSIVLATEYIAGDEYSPLTALQTAIARLFDSPSSVFLRTTPRDFVFDGIYVLCNTTSAVADIINRIVCNRIEEQTTATMPRLEDGRFRFSLLGHKNDSNDGLYSINSGINDVSQLGEIVAWENLTTVNTWSENSTCNNIIGTDSTIFPPFSTPESKLSTFSSDICRSATIVYSRPSEYGGINALRYVAPDNFLASPSNNSENDCFCLNRTEGIRGEDGCLLDGTLELWDCVGAPLVLSLPHFYQANEVYQAGVIGLNPNESLHQTFVDLEPVSGTPLRGGKRVQFNIFLKPVARITLTSNLTTTLMPILWIDEGVELNDELIELLKEQLITSLNLLSIITWCSIIIGGLIFTGGLIWLIISTLKRSEKVY